MAGITLDTVRKVYAGNVEAVKGVSIDIADGEFVVLVGPSGCGKSTLLRMIAGLEDITDGEIRIGDRLINKVEPADRDIAMVFQNYALYPHMSVFNNLAYGLKNRGVSKSEIQERVQEAARILEIGDYLDRKPRQLSGGQRQRVAMGRAIVRQPAAFLFDEPLSNLDAKLRVQMRIEIKRLQNRFGTTSVYVTHDQLEAMTLGDKLVVLNGGKIEQIGAPMDVYEKPASAFVAAFIGSPAMNLLDVTRTENGSWAINGGSALSAPAIIDQNNVTLGIRPEDVAIADAPGSEENCLCAELTVIAVEPVGAESLIHAAIGENGPEMVVRAAGKVQHPAGEKLHVKASVDKLHLFDRDSGARVS